MQQTMKFFSVVLALSVLCALPLDGQAQQTNSNESQGASGYGQLGNRGYNGNHYGEYRRFHGAGEGIGSPASASGDSAASTPPAQNDTGPASGMNRQQWLQNHPQAAQYLQNHPEMAERHQERREQMNGDRHQFMQNHPQARQFMQNHPEMAQKMRQDYRRDERQDIRRDERRMDRWQNARNGGQQNGPGNLQNSQQNGTHHQAWLQNHPEVAERMQARRQGGDFSGHRGQGGPGQMGQRFGGGNGFAGGHGGSSRH